MSKMRTLTINEEEFDIEDAGAVRFDSSQSLNEIQKKRAISNLGAIAEADLSYFGLLYSSAEKVYDISSAGSSVKLYLFATDNGYDAVVLGNGAIANYTEDGHREYVEKITRLHIEDGITSIGDYFMYKAFNLKSLTFANIGAITHLGTNAFAYTQIDGEYNFSGLTGTKLDAPFMACPKLQGVTFGGTITEIAVKSFQFCLALQYVNGLSFVTKIGDAAFQYCTELENIDVIPGNVTLGNWVFILTPTYTKIKGTDTDLSAAGWNGKGSICFVPNEWGEQLLAIQAVKGESIQFPIPESDNQKTDFYEQWKVFPAVRNGIYREKIQPVARSCGAFTLLHIYNLMNPDAPYDTVYDFLTRGIEPRKIKFTQDLKDAILAYQYGEILINGNADLYQVGNEITALDLPMAYDDNQVSWGEQGTTFWGICQALGWNATEWLFTKENDSTAPEKVISGAEGKQKILSELANGKPVLMEIVGAADTGHGMHIVTVIGYDAETDRLLIIDSTWAFSADNAPFVFWCSFESLTTPNVASAIWTFDFGEVVTMNDIDNDMKTLLERVNSGFKCVSGVFNLEEKKGSKNTDQFDVKFNIPAGAKIVMLEATEETMAAIENNTDWIYTLGFHANFADLIADSDQNALVMLWNGIQKVKNGSSKVATMSDDGCTVTAYSWMAGTYRWKAYYWND